MLSFSDAVLILFLRVVDTITIEAESVEQEVEDVVEDAEDAVDTTTINKINPRRNPSWI